MESQVVVLEKLAAGEPVPWARQLNRVACQCFRCGKHVHFPQSVPMQERICGSCQWAAESPVARAAEPSEKKARAHEAEDKEILKDVTKEMEEAHARLEAVLKEVGSMASEPVQEPGESPGFTEEERLRLRSVLEECSAVKKACEHGSVTLTASFIGADYTPRHRALCNYCGFFIDNAPIAVVKEGDEFVMKLREEMEARDRAAV